MAVPPAAKIDMTADRPEEKEFTAAWPGKGLTLGADAVFRPGLPTSDPTGAAAGTEVAHYLEVKGLTQDGSITDAPKLGASLGKQFRAKPSADFKGTALYRLWVVNEARFVMSVSGPADMKDADADEFFKTAVAHGGRVGRGPAVRQVDVLVQPDVPARGPAPGASRSRRCREQDNMFLMYPKDVEGGALFTLALMTAKLDPTIDAAKAYAAVEKAAKEGQFGEKPTNLRKKFLGRPGRIMFDDLRADIPYTGWAVYQNEEAAVVLSVRKNAGLTAADEKTFFDSVRIGITKSPEEQKPAAGPPGAAGGAPRAYRARGPGSRRCRAGR